MYNKFFLLFFKKAPTRVVESINLDEQSKIKKCHMPQPTPGPILILHSSQSPFGLSICPLIAETFDDLNSKFKSSPPHHQPGCLLQG